jgi:hypothetical protein
LRNSIYFKFELTESRFLSRLGGMLNNSKRQHFTLKKIFRHKIHQSGTCWLHKKGIFPFKILGILGTLGILGIL